MKSNAASWPLILLVSVTAFSAEGDLQFADFDKCKLESGDVIHDCRIGYRTYGALNQDRSNAILFPSWFTGKSQDIVTFDFVGSDRTLDSSRYFIVSVDALSNGVSSSPSNTAAPFPPISIGDMVDSQHRLLTQVLGISHLRAIVGISMGGAQTFEWVVRYPDFMDKAVPITGTPKQTAYDILLWDTQRRTIEELGDSESAAQIVAGIDYLVAYTPEYVAAKIGAADHAAAKEELVRENRQIGLLDRVPPLKAMIDHDVTRHAGGDLAATTRLVRAKMLIVVSPTDHAVNPAPSIKFAHTLGARLVQFDGTCGHLDSFCGREWLAPIVREFLATAR